ncbi:energy transducer TonB [Mucilaginibacter sp. L3T2-6]|uniref:energy transducer TonB n=1 Tax=Mucilaginibacter sp. L3T2-6 TaxID=3062491 RepID=UPI0026750FE8|nr:energy transducer TonB [Mucilaginibacter sp. L3T2-6]MDO3641190.1 energy transducer TonB [Mucilaginibacter sp. L3T2-6]MDV6213334.1 energy transducer TonB [Mucilaginibacter sp. L3T2-6]
MRTGEYVNGKFAGLETDYYHNGNVYNIKNYKRDGSVRFLECRDSTGRMLAEGGNGIWLEYNEDFKDTTAKGEILNGLMNGTWKGKTNDSGEFTNVYENGVLKQHDTFRKFEISPAVYASAKPGAIPTFPGGIEALYKFLAKTIRYPKEARDAGIQGKVVISFMVETDGSLSDVKIEKSVHALIDGEALKVIKLSPKWIPAMKDGKLVRMPYSVPINFAMSE